MLGFCLLLPVKFSFCWQDFAFNFKKSFSILFGTYTKPHISATDKLRQLATDLGDQHVQSLQKLGLSIKSFDREASLKRSKTFDHSVPDIDNVDLKLSLSIRHFDRSSQLKRSATLDHSKPVLDSPELKLGLSIRNFNKSHSLKQVQTIDRSEAMLEKLKLPLSIQNFETGTLKHVEPVDKSSPLHIYSLTRSFSCYQDYTDTPVKEDVEGMEEITEATSEGPSDGANEGELDQVFNETSDGTNDNDKNGAISSENAVKEHRKEINYKTDPGENGKNNKALSKKEDIGNDCESVKDKDGVSNESTEDGLLMDTNNETNNVVYKSQELKEDSGTTVGAVDSESGNLVCDTYKDQDNGASSYGSAVSVVNANHSYSEITDDDICQACKENECDIATESEDGAVDSLIKSNLTNIKQTCDKIDFQNVVVKESVKEM